jgi:exonuclease SbcD
VSDPTPTLAAVRILHTSDWHLGRTFHQVSLLDEQALVVDRIVTIAEEQQVDLVVIAGDLFDRAVPPADAIRLFASAVQRLRATGAAVAAISGNHDSPTRVGAFDELLAAGVSLRGEVARVAEPLVLTPEDEPPVHVYLVPFLDPVAARPVLEELGASVDPHDPPRRATHGEVTRMATDLVRAHATASAGVRTVVVAHTFAAGGEESKSERPLAIGTADVVNLSLFDGFHYVALGHLHGRQSFDGGRIAYSGTPLPYSFSEESHIKSVRIVDLADDGSIQFEDVVLGVGRPLMTVTGTFQQLTARDAFPEAKEAWVCARLTDAVLPPQVMARIKDHFRYAVTIDHQPTDVAETGQADPRERLRQTDPVELAKSFWLDVTGADATPEQLAVMADAYAAATREVDA